MLLALALAELYLRLCAPVSYRRPIALGEDVPPPEHLIHRASSVPGLDYELVPDLVKDLPRYRVETNAFGLRDAPTTLEKPSGVWRIAVLGDSVTFGIGVSNGDTWCDVLQRCASRASLAQGGRSCEVLNFAVSGYSSVDEARVLEGKALAFDPDLVIVGYYLNDPEHEPLQRLHRHFHRPLWWERFDLLRLVAMKKRVWDLRHVGGGDLFRYLHDPGGEHWASVLGAFRDIGAATKARGIPVLVVVLPTCFGYEDPAAAPRARGPGEITVSTRWTSWSEYPYRAIHAQVLAAARSFGFDAFDPLDALASSGHAPTELRYDAEHPNALGHRLLGEAICARLQGELARMRSERRDGDR